MGYNVVVEGGLQVGWYGMSGVCGYAAGNECVDMQRHQWNAVYGCMPLVLGIDSHGEFPGVSGYSVGIVSRNRSIYPQVAALMWGRLRLGRATGGRHDCGVLSRCRRSCGD